MENPYFDRIHHENLSLERGSRADLVPLKIVQGQMGREIVKSDTSSGTSNHSVLIASTPLTCSRYMNARTTQCSGLLIGHTTFHPTIGTVVSVRVGPNLVPDTARERTKEVTKIYHVITIIISCIDPVACACAIRALKRKRPAQC